ncbi:DUF2306 domain-containing protein [Pseudotenacibaculum sp. MALMAid0570]|uniref:DUF2306 domain-containing protein n=1 Tax=Pseudotenacibaculum sp. MALMAid0570 TaxID=3143938 RepID=UPI0032E014EC
MFKRIPYILLAIGGIGVGLYPILYFIMERTFGLLSSKSDTILTSDLWNSMFYTHIIFGGLALLIGWIQFSKKIQRKRIQLHRNIGKTYLISVLLSGVSGVYIGYYATGGLVPKIGFITLGFVWLFTTVKGYISIRKKDIVTHQKMMIYSYAACFAAVTLRIWLPILIASMGSFIPAYKIVAWLCWVPNIIVAYFIINRKFKIAASAS